MEKSQRATTSHYAGRQQDVPEAFSAAGLIVPDSIARVYCCRQDYQHPIPSRQYRGSFKSHSKAQVAGLCGPLCRYSRAGGAGLDPPPWPRGCRGARCLRFAQGGCLRLGACARATGRPDDARADDTGGLMRARAWGAEVGGRWWTVSLRSCCDGENARADEAGFGCSGCGGSKGAGGVKFERRASVDGG